MSRIASEKLMQARKILSLYNSGCSKEEIMAETGADYKRIRTVIYNNGLPVDFDNYRNPESPPAQRFIDEWEKVTAICRTRMEEKHGTVSECLF